MKRVLIFGANSSVGKQLRIDFEKKFNVLCLSRKEYKIGKSLKKLKKIIFGFKPHFIINCIAITKFEKCENNMLEAFFVNSFFPIQVVSLILNSKIKLIHFSSESVFKSSNILPNEKKFPNADSIYGKSKMLSDLALRNFKNIYIIRLPTLVGRTNNHQIINRLLEKIKNNEKVFVASDIISTPIFTKSLSNFLFKKISSNNFKMRNLIHFTSMKKLSTYDVLKELLKIGKIKFKKSNLNAVKDVFFKSNFKKPRNLGLTSLYKKNIIKFNPKYY